jgi:DNA-binding transcriptional MocR family regulator
MPDPAPERDNGRRAYRTEIPNIVDDMDLSVYAFRLYVHIRRVAGDSGSCWQGTRALAEACHMSLGKVGQAKRELEEAGLITISGRRTASGPGHDIAIVDIWEKNSAAFKRSPDEPIKRSPHERSTAKKPASVHHMNSCVHDMNAKRSPHEQKKEPLEERTIEEVTTNGEAAHDAAPPAPEVHQSPLQEKTYRNGTAKETPSSAAPPTDHPNIAIYREVCRNKPNLTQQELIAEARMDSEEWRTTCKAWMAKGYSPRNVSGLLDSHLNRTTGRRRAGPEEAAVSPLDFTTLTLEEKRAIRAGGRTGT